MNFYLAKRANVQELEECKYSDIIYLFRVSVEVEINHDLPWDLSWDGTSQSEYLTSQEPPGKTDGVDWLVVGWDGNVYVSGWSIRVTQSNDWDVDIWCLSDGLMIGTWVSDDKQTGLTVVLL